jgi:Tol biopolymer transport system component
MRQVIRRALGAGVLVLLLVASPAAAAAPVGPRLAVIKVAPKPPRLELVSVNRNGGDPLRLAGGASRARPFLSVFSPLSIFSPISWSSDGERLAFGGIVGFGRGDDPEPIEKLFVVGADGKGLRAIPGTKGGSGPVFSSDGRTVAFTRSIERRGPITVGGQRWEHGFRGSSIWTVDLVTGARRQLTPWEDGVDYAASSFSPDGSTLLATHEDERLLYEAEPVVLAVDGSGSRRLLDDGFAPVYSPDGSRVALVRRIEEYGKEEGEGMDLYVVNADGSGLRRLTRTPDLLELSPSWDPSGERLAYVRLPANRREDAPFGFRSVLMQVNADGTCKTKVVSAGRTFYFLPTWQPGPGREAGRIGC